MERSSNHEKDLRNPATSAKGATTSSCELCQEPDSETMVQCDLCDRWYHFSCVDVGDSIADKDFVCVQCNQRARHLTSDHGKADHGKDYLSTNKEMDQGVFYTRPPATDTTITEANKMRLCATTCGFAQIQPKINDTAITTGQRPFACPLMTTQTPSQILGWQQSNYATTSITTASQDPRSYGATCNIGPAQLHTNEISSFRVSPSQKPIDPSATSTGMYSSFLHNISTLACPPPINIKNATYNTTAPPIFGLPPSSHNHTFLANNTTPPSHIPRLNADQLAARQAMPKDLPIFSGHPHEWPLFVSNFVGTTEACGFSNAENLIRLQRCLKGRALEAVRSQLLLPHTVPNVIETLKLLFGRPEIIINSLLQAIRSQPTPKSEKLDTIITYALSVQNLCATMEAAELSAHLCNPSLLYELVDRLPAQLKLSWALYKQQILNATLSAFSQWLFQIAKAASDVTIPSFEVLHETKSPKRPASERGYLHTHSENEIRENNNFSTQAASNEVRDNTERKCRVCKGSHKVTECPEFQKFNHSQRWNAVKEHNLCRQCLGYHFSTTCKSKKRCGKNECLFRHHPSLHNDAKDKEKPASSNISPQTTGSNCNTHRQPSSSVLFRIIPIVLYGKNSSIKTFAFLDEGSSLTLIEEGLANELELNGVQDSLCLKWTSNTIRYEPESKRVSLDISGTYSNAGRYKITNVRTIKSLNLPTQSIDVTKIKEKYPYLKDIPLEPYAGGVPKILIGIDNWKLGIPHEIREGKWRQAVATRCRLGWTLHGCSSDTAPQVSPYSDAQPNLHICDCQPGQELHELVKTFFSTDSLGVKVPDTIPESRDDSRARQMMIAATIRKGDRFQTGLLWKHNNISLPKSIDMAYSRLFCLEKQMERNPKLKEIITQAIRDYVSKGYARKLDTEELKKEYPRVWYLPFFVVTNPNKPGKHRIVWDAAAKVHGTSLNSFLLKGPDQLSTLLHMLFKFRERKFAISGDIREMFHQVLISEEDQQVQRFLWRENNSTEPDTYVLQVMTFGATCSPSLAQFVKNSNAKHFEERYPRAARAIMEEHYVDDMLTSVDTEEEAISLAMDVRFIHAQAGFEIRNWMSNSLKVISALTGALNNETKDLNISPETNTEKVLGMWWDVATDTLTYSLRYNKVNKEVLSGERCPTKREVLRTLMSVYDPLGLLSSFLVYVKILLREIWRSALDWDDKLTGQLNDKWRKWVLALPSIEKLYIPRCYPREVSSKQLGVQLHVFVDASELAYATAAYIRIENDTGVTCSLISAKAKVSPQTIVSIPRLELQAAVIGARLANSIHEGHSLSFTRRVFWSDSKTVLTWLKSDSRVFRQYVAFRVGEILETTNLREWRWVPSKLNVADEATKWSKVQEMAPTSRWFTGPEFLLESEDKWPTNLDEEYVLNDEELRPTFFHSTESNKIVEIERFSNWLRLLRTLAYVVRFVNNIKAKTKKTLARKGPLEPDEAEIAENLLYKMAQLNWYAEEIGTLKRNQDLRSDQKKSIDKTSTIYNRSPYLDDAGVLRVRGRIDQAENVSFGTKRPILLPKNDPLTHLIINHYHRNYHHQNHETVVNEIRQSYDIPTLRSLLKKIVRSCQRCKNQAAHPRPPEMAPLPAARLASFVRPFTYVGIDYFGPISVTVGRHIEKRWGVIFTCLTIRAVHIEIAYSLSTDSCIMAIRNFIARRGIPQEFYTDNGTNFRGTDQELRTTIANLDNDRIREDVSADMKIKWNFNPPAAPHMGGSWERMIRSIKKSLKQITLTRNPRDELLRAVLMEIEMIVNSRPLTYVPIENDNAEALTPNHLLLGSSNGKKLPGDFTDNPLTLRENWKRSQQLANSFWRRWVKEYLPDLTRRTKWFERVEPIKEGDVVIIVDHTAQRNMWRKGIVIETVTGKGVQVRQARVQTSTGVLVRPAVKLAKLDVLQPEMMVSKTD